ncbi:hypothetical protein CPB86DRAFT_712788 [Serendipita vermifera]|nr:hypothetical protein CPB86DRAFT_712788 [Serendipita vermifera]
MATWKTAFDSGVKLFRDREYEKAIGKFSEAISLGAQGHVALDSRAACYENLEKYKEALIDSRKVISLYPELPHGYSRSSKILTRLGKHERAVALAKNALDRVKPDNTKAFNTMQNLLDAALLAQHKHEQLLKEKQCNVTKLPFELLALIFEQLVHIHLISPTKISLVCRQWRSIILDMPGLWNTLRLNGKKAEWRTNFWMKHSQGRIANLVVHTSKNLEACIQKMGPNTTSQLEKVALDFKYVGENLPNFFRFEADPIVFMWTARRLFNDATRRLPFEPKEEPFRMEELILVGIDLYWNIEVQQIQNLRVVCIQETNIPLPELLILLEKSPEIESLEVQVGSPAMPSPEKRLVLPKLTTLKLMLDASLIQFIEFPALTSFHATSIDLGRALPMFSPAVPPLTMWRFQGCSKLQETVLPLPDTLTSLIVRGSSLDPDKLVDRLVAGECPNLTHFDISSSKVTTSPIIRLVKSRNSPDPNKDESESKSRTKIQQLIMDGCSEIDSGVLGWLESRVPLMSCVYEKKTSKRRRLF